MTREEIVNSMSLQDAIQVFKDTNAYGTMDIAKTVILKALEQEPRWIPVGERLPKANTAVLTFVDTGVCKTYCLAYWNNVRDGWEEWIGYDLIEKERGYKVLAWMSCMPIPQPYKAESEEV